MRTGSKAVSARTDRFGMRCMGIMMFFMVFIFAGLGENPVCHASSLIDIGRKFPDMELNCESSVTVWVKDIVPSDSVKNVYVSVHYQNGDKMSDIIPESDHYLLHEYPSDPGKYQARLDCFSQSGIYYVCIYALNMNDKPSETVCSLVTKFCKGDLNNDDHVDIADAILALRVLSGINPSNLIADYGSSLDVNGDNSIGLEELIYILQIAASLRQ